MKKNSDNKSTLTYCNCPHCGYANENYLTSCPECGRDLTVDDPPIADYQLKIEED